MNVIWPIFIFLALSTTLTTLILIHVLVAQINSTNPAQKIPHRVRWSWQALIDIKQQHRSLFPNSGTYKLFRVLEVWQIIAGIAIGLAIVTSFVGQVF